MASALIFDCDGTLADTMPAHYQAWLEILRPHGVVFSESRFYDLGGVPTNEIAKLLFGQAGLQVDPLAIAAAKEQAFLTRIQHVQPIHRVVDVARAARGTVPMSVASGGLRSVVELTLKQIGVTEWFSVVVTAEDTARHKPEPDVFLEAARRMNVPADICTVYEDTDLGIEAARRAGMQWVDIRKM